MQWFARVAITATPKGRKESELVKLRFVDFAFVKCVLKQINHLAMVKER